ncbi:MAG: hypothetical protein K2J44_07610 [Ruminococcus sp.]|nr:hypothetical protein [Ruminococcus sp.]
MIYRLHYTKLFGIYVEPEENAFQDIQFACMMSEFHKISPEKIQIYTSDTVGGLDFPDFYYDDSVPLFSEKVYRNIAENGVDNLFTKKITVTDRIQKKSQIYIMAVPPCIIDYSLSETECITEGYNPLYDVRKLVIDERKTGNYQIFKLSNVLDNSIYITENTHTILHRKYVQPVIYKTSYRTISIPSGLIFFRRMYVIFRSTAVNQNFSIAPSPIDFTKINHFSFIEVWAICEQISSIVLYLYG